jgi:hypothetical protein
MSPSGASGLELIGDREPADPLAGRGEDRVAQRWRNRRTGAPDTAERQAEVRRNQVHLNVARCDVPRAVFRSTVMNRIHCATVQSVAREKTRSSPRIHATVSGSVH